MSPLLRKGGRIILSLHYTPDGSPVKERTRVGFKFAKEPPKFRVIGHVIRRMVPHMHLRG